MSGKGQGAAHGGGGKQEAEAEKLFTSLIKTDFLRQTDALSPVALALHEAADDLFARIDSASDDTLKSIMRAAGVEDMNGADLRGADLQGQDLSGISFVHADFTQADLRNSNLSGCDLRGARLVQARLAGAKLGDAVVYGADFTGGKFSDVSVPRFLLGCGAILLGIYWLRASRDRSDEHYLSQDDLEFGRFDEDEAAVANEPVIADFI